MKRKLLKSPCRFPVRALAAAGIALAVALGPAAGSLLAQAPDLTSMGVLLEQNRQDLRFFDTAVSNLPPENPDGGPNELRARLIEQYTEALRHDFYANLWYMQGDYGRTHRELKKSQNFLQQSYRRILERYIETTWALLEESAPLIVRSRDQQARHLLRLGFRDLESSRAFHTRGSNINPRLHTNQIQYYRDGLKRIRRARRYALLAMIEAKLPREDKAEFQVVTYDDIRNAEDEEKESDFQRVLKRLINLTGRQLLPGTVTTRNLARPAELDLLEVHQDNYNRLIADRKSVWLEETAKLDTQGFHSDYSLPRRNSDNKDDVPAEDSDPEEPIGPGNETQPEGP